MIARKFIVLCILVVIVAGSLFTGCSRSEHDSTAAESKTLYTCGMHPQIIQDHPGNCPICGMKLTPIRSSGANGTNSAAIAIDPVTIQNMNLRTAAVTNGPLRRILRSVGTVDFDESSLTDVTTKFKGWIEKLHVDTTGRQVHKGETLFEIYSPELYSAQVEYVMALEPAVRGGTDGGNLRSTALTKLNFFDVSPEQIAELEKSREPKKILRVVASRDGVVVEKMVVAGQMVDAGMRLYRLADLSLVWVLAQVYEQDLPFVKLGQEAVVRLSYLPDREFRGRVTYIYPTLDEKTRTAKVRMEFHNPGFFLKPGMFATVELRSELEPSALLVPDSAVLRSGEKNTVFVALDAGRFEARTVTLGSRAEHGFYQVLSGLQEGERVVTSGQFMLDSESQLREAIQKLSSAGRTNSAATSTVAASERRPSAGTVTNAVAFICPMPEHVAIKYDHPGQCPICGMALMPVSAATLARIHPGGHVEYYTCPMTDDCPTPGHGLVRQEKGGKCPLCGMTLIPVMEALAATNTIATNTPAAAALPKLFTCPMASHADVVSDKPGDCAKCGMTLVPTDTVSHGKTAEQNWLKQKEHQH